MEIVMRVTQKLFGGLVLFAMAFGLALLPQRAASGSPSGMPGMQQGGADDSVPAFHAQAPKDALPATMSPALFQDTLVANAYTVAGRIKKTLYQMPCYCHCDRSQGHGSLLDCFASRHGSACEVCIREDLYTYEETRKAIPAAKIREGIIRGEWSRLDITRYQQGLLPAAK
jgi:Protein of unknown function with PCYCGC motif